MTRHRFVCLSAIVVVAALVGCAGVQPPPPPPPAPAVEPGPYLSKARSAAAKGDLQKALAYLRLAAAISPEDPSVTAERDRIQAEARAKAEEHFRRGEDNFKRKRLTAAQRDFMLALRYDPTHAGAMDYLRHRLAPPATTDYQVAKGDSLGKIAKKVYNDPDKAFLIAYFNDLAETEAPPPGTTLKLPLLGDTAAAKSAEGKGGQAQAAAGGKTPGEAQAASRGADQPPMDEMVLTIYEDQQSDVERDLVQARLLMKKRDYDAVIPLSRQILARDPANEEAADLVNAAYYQKGEDLLKKRNYEESLEMYEEVQPGYRDISARIGQVRTAMKEEAEQYYLKGVNFYVNENLPGAIDAWEKTLALDPGHQKASQDIEKARLLLKKLQAIQ